MAVRIGLALAWTTVVLVALIFIGGNIRPCPETKTVGMNRTEAEQAELLRICEERSRAAMDPIERNQSWLVLGTWAAGIALIVIVTRGRPVEPGGP
jgi:hypothetical protein